jgi:hypothetical protein
MTLHVVSTNSLAEAMPGSAFESSVDAPQTPSRHPAQSTRSADYKVDDVASRECASTREQARMISFAPLSLCHRSRREPTAPRHARCSSLASARLMVVRATALASRRQRAYA